MAFPVVRLRRNNRPRIGVKQGRRDCPRNLHESHERIVNFQKAEKIRVDSWAKNTVMNITHPRVKACIIDYGLGNLFSVHNACLYAGMDALISSSKDDIFKSDLVILPGVGAFSDAMNVLKSMDLVEPLKDYIAAGSPLIGICLGLQLLMSESYEFGVHKGLNIIEGEVVRFDNGHSANRVKVPNTGWCRIQQATDNNVNGSAWGSSPLSSINDGEYMYFVHSYYIKPVSRQVMVSTSEYEGTVFCSSIQKGNVFACQFHPERSGPAGLEIYNNIEKLAFVKQGDDG